MLHVLVNGTKIPLRMDGGLQNLADWNKDVALALAKKEGLILTTKHWDIIELMREYYLEFNISPISKLLKKTIGEKLGREKASQTYLSDLFPGNALVQGIRVAGIPFPLLDAELDVFDLELSSAPMASETHTIEFDGKSIQLHRSGNLRYLEDWNEKLAAVVAQQNGIKLTADHWEVIHFLRSFYFEYGITPMVKLLIKHIAEKLGKDKATSEYLYTLFPHGPSRQGSRIAGLPEPQGCIDP